MTCSRKLTSLLITLASLLVLSITTLADDPGNFPINAQEGADSDFPGSILVYNLYASSAANPAAENTRISLTNTNDQNNVSVHFFYIDGSTCSVADNYFCLTKNQTATFYASDVDPGTRGYIIAFATYKSGLIDPYARLIGDEYVKLASGHNGKFPAQVVFALGSQLNLDGSGGFQLNFAPRVLAIPNIPSPAEGNNTLLVVNRLGGDLRVAMKGVGDIFGILYDQLENPYSWSSRGGCQLMGTLGPTFPRTTPRIGNVIPAGSVGWMKFWSASPGDVDINGDGRFDSPGRSITGCYLNFNANAGNSATAFNGGQNLNALRINTLEFISYPIFPPNCGFEDSVTD